MNVRFFLYLFLTGSLLAFLIASIALVPSLKHHPEESILSYNDVQGMAVESNGVVYTLNFEQQNQVIAILNRGEDLAKMEVDKLIIYRFKQPEKIIYIK